MDVSGLAMACKTFRAMGNLILVGERGDVGRGSDNLSRHILGKGRSIENQVYIWIFKTIMFSMLSKDVHFVDFPKLILNNLNTFYRIRIIKLY